MARTTARLRSAVMNMSQLVSPPRRRPRGRVGRDRNEVCKAQGVPRSCEGGAKEVSSQHAHGDVLVGVRVWVTGVALVPGVVQVGDRGVAVGRVVGGGLDAPPLLEEDEHVGGGVVIRVEGVMRGELAKLTGSSEGLGGLNALKDGGGLGLGDLVANVPGVVHAMRAGGVGLRVGLRRGTRLGVERV